VNTLICIIGHTAGGKTGLATQLCHAIGGEIISADSRQVYRGMDIGTGKDIEEYTVNGVEIPYHLIDIRIPGDKYNVFEFCNDAKKVLSEIRQRKRQAVLCGGTGLYIEALLKNYSMLNVPINEALRQRLQHKTLDELSIILAQYRKLHNHTDTDTVKRAIRAIEIADYQMHHGEPAGEAPTADALIFGIAYPRDERRRRITERLDYRLNNGMIEEAERLLRNGLSHEDMEYYGLEYKYLSLFLSKKINRNQLFEQLNTAIHQFAKRQMTWFRKMERSGFNIHWLDYTMSHSDTIDSMLAEIKKLPDAT